MYMVLVALTETPKDMYMVLVALTETPKTWSVLLACSRRGRALLSMLRSLRQLGDNMEELYDRVGLNAHHQDSSENSDELAISYAQGNVSFLMMSKPSTQDCTSCVFYPVCTHCG